MKSQETLTNVGLTGKICKTTVPFSRDILIFDIAIIM